MNRENSLKLNRYRMYIHHPKTSYVMSPSFLFVHARPDRPANFPRTAPWSDETNTCRATINQTFQQAETTCAIRSLQQTNQADFRQNKLSLHVVELSRLNEVGKVAARHLRHGRHAAPLSALKDEETGSERPRH